MFRNSDRFKPWLSCFTWNKWACNLYNRIKKRETEWNTRWWNTSNRREVKAEICDCGPTFSRENMKLTRTSNCFCHLITCHHVFTCLLILHCVEFVHHKHHWYSYFVMFISLCITDSLDHVKMLMRIFLGNLRCEFKLLMLLLAYWNISRTQCIEAVAWNIWLTDIINSLKECWLSSSWMSEMQSCWMMWQEIKLWPPLPCFH